MELAAQKACDVIFTDYLLRVIPPNHSLSSVQTSVVVYQEETWESRKMKRKLSTCCLCLQTYAHGIYRVSIITEENGRCQTNTFFEKTDVTFYPIFREDLLRYIASGDCLDKAGAYGIQGDFAIHIKEIQGDYNNVVGLPIGRVYRELKKEY